MPRRVRALLSTALLVVFGCSAEPATRGARSVRAPVTVADAVERPMPLLLTAAGTVEPLQSAAVGSQVGGVVTRVAFREGDDVRAGQVLFELDARPFRAALDQALATLARDRARAETARLEAERGQRLYDQQMLSQAEWDQKQADAAALAATVLADSAAAGTARLNLEFASIRAPISGRTGRLLAREGNYVRAATSEPLVTIVQSSPVRVRFAIPERDVPLLQRYRRSNPRVVVRQDGGAAPPLEGALVFVDNAVDPASGTLLLKGEFPNRDGSLVPGQFVDVRLVLHTEPRALVVPAQAVIAGQQGPYVYLLHPDSTVAPCAVKVERTVDALAIVSEGLRAGDRVVTDGQLRLSPGARVTIRAPSGAAP
jgi:multidrug efflux system membrane fusion protein